MRGLHPSFLKFVVVDCGVVAYEEARGRASQLFESRQVLLMLLKLGPAECTHGHQTSLLDLLHHTSEHEPCAVWK